MRRAICLCVLTLWCAPGMVRAVGSGVHLWAFDENAGTRAADGVGDSAGVVHGARWTVGRIGSGLRFDGWDDYVALPCNHPVWLPVNDFTVSFWVYFERDKGSSVAESEVLVDLNHGASSDPWNELGCNIQRRGDTGKIAFQMTTLNATDEDLYSQFIPAQETWYHVVAVRQGALQRIYIDGRLDAWRACCPSAIDFVGGYDDDLVSVGRYTAAIGLPRYHFKGVLDELILVDRALSSSEIQSLCWETSASRVLYVDATHGSDENDGFRSLTPLATIQTAVALAADRDMIALGPGVYRGPVDLTGRAITLQSAGDAAILEAPGEVAVSLGADGLLRNVIIRNSLIGVLVAGGSPRITNVTLVGNGVGVQALTGASPRIGNSIFWGNTEGDLDGCQATYSCLPRGDPGEGNFRDDPLFADPENDDYHVRSARGRYWPENDIWVLDEVTSPCVDAGDPAADFSREPRPNGGRLNVGAHGGTAFAALSEPPFNVDVNIDGMIDVSDLELFLDLWEYYGEPKSPIRR